MSLANSNTSTSKRKYPHVVTFTFDTLKLELLLMLKDASKSQQWQVPLGLFVPLLFTCVVTEFVPKYGLEADHWEMFTYVMTGLSFIWLAISIWHSKRSKNLDAIVDDIYKKSITKNEHRVLFFIKAITEDATEKLLVYKDPAWGCYLLPHVRSSQRQNEEADLKHILSQNLKVNASNISINHMVGLETESYKYAYHTKKDTYYVFDFYYAHLSGTSCEKINKSMFNVDGTNFYWKTVTELLNDKKTFERNGDVILHIRDNYHVFFDSSLSNSITTPLA